MKLRLAILFFINSIHFFFAQNIVISGKLLGTENNAIENATIYLLREKDSSIVAYSSSSKEGNFKIKLSAMHEPSVLKIEADKQLPHLKKLEKITENLDLGSIVLERKLESNIDEVVIKSSPIKIKKDTIEFNASAIKVRPDAKIEEMLKQIPGVEIDNDGKITINGKEVDKILVNGKPFFDKDGKIALKNLPADLIKNIQFTTSKTKQEELSGKIAKSNNAAINFTIDDKKNKGFLGRLTAGYGSDKRYETSLLASYFKKDTKVSLLASSNNINSQGFSNDEVFDSMGNGRNSWLLKGGSVSYNGGGTYFRMNDNAEKGIMKSETLGINYSDKLGKVADLETMSLMFLNNQQNNKSKSNRTTLLPDYSLQTLSESESENESKNLSFDQQIVIKPDTLTSIQFKPGFTSNWTNGRQSSFSETNKNGVKLYDNKTINITDGINNSFNPSLYINRKFGKKGRSISASVYNNFTQSNTNKQSISETNFYQAGGSDDKRNQYSKGKTSAMDHNYELSYTEPISDSATVSVGIDYQINSINNQVNLNDYNTTTGLYSQYNGLLSYTMSKNEHTISPNIGFEMEKKKLNIWAGMYMNISQQKIESESQGHRFSMDRNSIIPNSYFGLDYKITETSNLNLYNNIWFNTPSVAQLSTFTDYSNPLVTLTGNPDLKNSLSNYFGLNFTNTNIQKGVNYFVNAGYNFSDNSITNYSTYDTNGKQAITYANISGNKSFRLSLGYSKTYKWDENKSKITIGPRISQNYSFSKGYINGEIFSSKIYSLSPGLYLNYEVKDLFSIKPSYSLNYYTSRYDNYILDKANSTANKVKLELTNYFLNTRLVIGNDFEYNTNSIIEPGYKKDFYFWNTSVGYAFWDKQLTAKVKVYDILNQNQSIVRNISSSFVEDREDLILKRYIMFSFTLKLNKFAGKKM
jgi:hypothetical protein